MQKEDLEREEKGRALKKKTITKMEWLLSRILAENSQAILLDKVSPLRYSFMLEEIREMKPSRFFENLYFISSKNFNSISRNAEPHLAFLYIYLRAKGKFIVNPGLENLADLTKGMYLSVRLQKGTKDTDWKATLPHLSERLETELCRKKSYKKELASFTDKELDILSSVLTYSYNICGHKFWDTGSSIRWQIDSRHLETKEGYRDFLEEFLEDYTHQKKLIKAGEKTPKEVLDTLGENISNSLAFTLNRGADAPRVFSYRCIELSRDLAKLELLRDRQDSRLDKGVSTYQKRKLRIPLQEEVSKKKQELKEYLDLYSISLEDQVEDYLRDCTPYIYIARELYKYRLEKKLLKLIPELGY